MESNAEYDAVLQVVSQWPAEQRITLAHDVLETLRAHGRDEAGVKSTLDRALGLGRGAGEPPSDEQVENWLEERRMEKHG
jgi:hypothetical protein